MDGRAGDRLRRVVREAGAPFDFGPGYPNPSERTESGLLNYGTDTDDQTNPQEARMSRFVDLDLGDDVIGIRALREIAPAGVKRRQLGIILDMPQEEEDHSIWQEIVRQGVVVGQMTHKAWSCRMQRMIGFALVSSDPEPGDAVRVKRDADEVQGVLNASPFRV